jgi:hypothetical protein
MGEYEDRYPDAYGRGETIEAPRKGHFRTASLPRQTRDPAVPSSERPATQPQFVEPTLSHAIGRGPDDVAKDIARQLSESPFIDASGITIAVEGSEVTLDGTINSLTARALAQALCSNVEGVGRIQLRLRVQGPAQT